MIKHVYRFALYSRAKEKQALCDRDREINKAAKQQGFLILHASENPRKIHRKKTAKKQRTKVGLLQGF